MSQVALTFPNSTYSTSTKPSVATLKADLAAIETAHNDTDTNAVTLTGTQVLTNKTLTSPTINGGVIKANINSPQGFLINGKISVTDAAGITVAIKTLAGTDPSATDPVYVRIGDTVRTISAALSVTAADGTNWFESGKAELYGKEVDYFAYLGYNATDGVVIGFSRIIGNQYSDFTTAANTEKFCKISTITNAASTDYYEVIGRFAAILSTSAAYTWSVPTFTAINLIQRPIYETRVLTWLPTYVGWTSNTATGTYRVIGSTLVTYPFVPTGTSNSATTTGTLPFTNGGGVFLTSFGLINNSVFASAVGRIYVANASASIQWGITVNVDNGFTASGTKTLYMPSMIFQI